jgi:small-conductance mechanosensitive channel
MHSTEENTTILRLASYIGLVALIQECVVAIKTARLLIFEYLYLSHMRVAFPLLLVNLFTLLLTVIIFGWLISTVFAIQIAPLVATSAVFSLVLGLALQDTIGNLFAGVALQFDKPYEIGDWIEIQTGGNRWIGQVHEISWRATILHGFTDETITIPNKVMSQAQISNFAAKNRPFARSQAFKVPFESPSTEVKRALLEAADSTQGLRRDLPPIVIITETGDSWVTYKLVYYLENFGSQFLVADQIIESALNKLKERKIPLANPRMTLMPRNSTRA